MAKIIKAVEAAKSVNDNDTIAFAVDSLVGYPKELMLAVRKRFDETGHPSNIPVFRLAGFGTF